MKLGLVFPLLLAGCGGATFEAEPADPCGQSYPAYAYACTDPGTVAECLTPSGVPEECHDDGAVLTFSCGCPASSPCATWQSDAGMVVGCRP